eukprot:NP_001122430.1 Uncharacterized protein CELE_C41G7.8 [Caenorhabditis elegans]
MEKENNLNFYSNESRNENDELSVNWQWKEIHLPFTIATSPLPLYLIIVGVLTIFDQDTLLSIWMIFTGFTMGLELLYISVYLGRKSIKHQTELDLDDQIFEKYESSENQNVKDPLMRKAIKLHITTAFLAYFGLLQCYIILTNDSNRNSYKYNDGIE